MRNCATCGESFASRNHLHRYCSKPCRRKGAQNYGAETTERQYALISGNWGKYFGRLCVRSFRRELITKQDCMEILVAQDYKCALSGVPLTCILEKGVIHKTNASIDRIDPKLGYAKNNIQLVCSALNKFRVDTPLNEFVDWCTKVANYAVQKQG